MARVPFLCVAALLLASLPLAAVNAQPGDAPPRLAPVAPAAPARDSSRVAAPAAVSPAPTIIEDEALDDLPPARTTLPEARIEQRRQGNRVVEMTVTPAGSTRSYTIVNREGQRPLSVQELSSGLSTPRFFRLDF